jgi:hypothetical protein
MTDGHKPTPEQKRRATTTAVVLFVMVAAIYATYMLKFAR